MSEQAVVVDMSGNWSRHAAPLNGFEMMGTVQIGSSSVGALARAYATGDYFQVSGAQVREVSRFSIEENLDRYLAVR